VTTTTDTTAPDTRTDTTTDTPTTDTTSTDTPPALAADDADAGQDGQNGAQERPDDPEGTGSTPDASTDATDGGQEDTGTTRRERDAAKYRQQARAAESERDAVAAQLEAQRTAIVGQVLAGGVDVPAVDVPPSLWSPRTADAVFGGGLEAATVRLTLHDVGDLARFTGTTAADYLDDAGAVDPAKVAAAARELVTARPYLFTNPDAPATRGPVVPSEGRSHVAAAGAREPGEVIAEAFRPKRPR